MNRDKYFNLREPLRTDAETQIQHNLMDPELFFPILNSLETAFGQREPK